MLEEYSSLRQWKIPIPSKWAYNLHLCQLCLANHRMKGWCVILSLQNELLNGCLTSLCPASLSYRGHYKWIIDAYLFLTVSLWASNWVKLSLSLSLSLYIYIYIYIYIYVYIYIYGLCPCVATEKSRRCLPYHGLIFFRPQSVNYGIAFHSRFLSFNCAGREAIIWEVFGAAGGPVLRGVWSCQIDIDNPYVLVVYRI